MQQSFSPGSYIFGYIASDEDEECFCEIIAALTEYELDNIIVDFLLPVAYVNPLTTIV